MENDAKNRVDTAVPQPDAANQLSDREKRALELSEEADHAHGEHREQATRQAGELGDAAQE